MHDILDDEDLAKELAHDTATQNVDDVVMTTWHPDESLEEALWYFIHSAFPAKNYTQGCAAWVVAPIGNPAWEEEIRSKIRKVVFESLAD